jgi:hypothetical protein
MKINQKLHVSYLYIQFICLHILLYSWYELLLIII